MGSEEEDRPRLPYLFSHPTLRLRSPEHSGTLTPPVNTLASVPFRWEEEPGKPLPCTALALALTNHHSFKCLDLPPRLLNEAKLTKTPSPTTVLESPYNSQVGRSILESSSLRFLIRKRRQGSFDDGGTRALSFGGSSPDRGLLGAMVLSSNTSSKKERGLFGSWRKRGATSEVHGGNFVFSSFSDDGTGSYECDDIDAGSTVKVRMSRKRSLSPAKSHFWATIYGALKQVMPRRSTKWRKGAL